MPRIIIYPYKMASESSVHLAEALTSIEHRSLRVRPYGAYAPREDDVIINWGNSTIPNWSTLNILNHPYNVDLAANKKYALERLTVTNVPTIEWTDNVQTAMNWSIEGSTVMCRTLLRSHSGGGIVIARAQDELVMAPLYTKYKKKRSEYRVHVFKDEVIDVQEKRRITGFERTDDEALVRSHSNGWVFCRDEILVTVELQNTAIWAVSSLGLDFGAVDIIYNQRENRYYVLEVNTAVGLEGQTLESYKNAILRHYNDKQLENAVANA